MKQCYNKHTEKLQVDLQQYRFCRCHKTDV